VKKPGGDVRSAGCQLATYRRFFEALAKTGHDLAAVLAVRVEQKRSVSLIPSVASSRVRSCRPVPIIAAPDDRLDWLARWQSDTAARDACGDLLEDLEFWRLSEDGVLLERVRP